MKNRKILSAVITAAILACSAAPSYTAFAEGTSDQTTIQTPAVQAELSKAPVGYGGLTLTANTGGDIYGISLTEAQLKALKFSPADEALGRGDGYHAGFHVDALDEAKGATSITYARTTRFLADVSDATIKGLSYETGTSKDGQFWIGFQKSWIDMATEEKPFIVYAIKATYAADDVKYYYIALDCREIPDDFTFEEPEGPESCADNHTANEACPICGNYAKVTVTNTTAADANGSITIKDADGAAVTEAAKNDKITITVTPDEGYVLDKLEINGTSVEVTGTTYTHTMDGAATTVKATFTAAKAEDETATLTASADKKVISVVNGETKTEYTVLRVAKADAESYAGVKVTVKAGDWEKTSALITTCYAKVVYTAADTSKTTVDAGEDFVIAVTVKDVPKDTTVTYTVTPANE